jgi:hypothetical protein
VPVSVFLVGEEVGSLDEGRASPQAGHDQELSPRSTELVTTFTRDRTTTVFAGDGQFRQVVPDEVCEP